MKGAPLLRESGVRMPAIYLAESTGPSPGDGKGGGYLDSSYDFVFEYLSSDLFHQSSELQLQEAKAALELLARFYAYFWVPGVENGGGDVNTRGDDISGSFHRYNLNLIVSEPLIVCKFDHHVSHSHI
jgi:hypothetical protein